MLIIVQNDPEVPAGSYGDYLAEWAISFRILKPYAGEQLPPAAQLSAIIVLGGAMGVHETDRHPFLLPVKRFIADAVAVGTPFLGICLGGQLLADVCGAPVTARSPWGEKGTLTVSLTDAGAADPLFEGLPREFITFQWHNDSFAIPATGALLASSSACPNQAFRIGHAWGTQFHPEVNREIVDTWARWTDETAPRVGQFLDDFDRQREAYASASRQMLLNFLRLAGVR